MTRTIRRTVAGLVLSMALLIPCFWQQRIQAGDLSSHIYNAWLAQLIERGQAPGLSLAQQSNNVLFDLMLAGLMRVSGPAAAQRIAVSCAVLVFFWGAFAFVYSCTRPRRVPWELIPWLAMLAYGWVFRMGLFNFYISLGLSFAAMALARRHRRWAWAAAILLAGIAYVAHPLPVAWAIAVLAYEQVARAIAPRRRSSLMMGAIAAMALAGLLLAVLFPTRRGLDQVISLTGVDQVWIYGKPYIVLAVAMLALWVASLQRVVSFRGARRTLLSVPFQLCALSAAALVLLPAGVLLPGYRSGLDFLPERMSLAGAVLFCGLMASAHLPKALTIAMAAVALVFFGLSYADERALNGLETRMDQAVAQLPPGQRVLSALEAPDSRIRSLTHLIDRACLGRCFSYANYEPCTWQFRVRAARENPIVVSNYGDSWNLQTGGYVVKARDLPLYRIGLCESAKDTLCVAPLEAGDTLRNLGLRMAQIRDVERNYHGY